MSHRGISLIFTYMSSPCASLSHDYNTDDVSVRSRYWSCQSHHLSEEVGVDYEGYKTWRRFFFLSADVRNDALLCSGWPWGRHLSIQTAILIRLFTCQDSKSSEIKIKSKRRAKKRTLLDSQEYQVYSLSSKNQCIFCFYFLKEVPTSYVRIAASTCVSLTWRSENCMVCCTADTKTQYHYRAWSTVTDALWDR